MCDVPQVFVAIILPVSLTYACPCLNIPIGWCSLDTCRDERLGWLSVPLLALPGLCRLRGLLVTTVWSWDRHSVAVALSPSLTVAMTPCNCGALGDLYVLVGLNLSLTGTYVWSFLLWTLAVPSDWDDLPSPSSHFQDSVSCLTCSQDSQLLRHPAIDIVWRWPCLPRFRLL